MAFNDRVFTQNPLNTMVSDKQQIANLGGPSKVSDLLGYSKSSGPQRVYNWTIRASGIPAKVKLDRPDLFPNPKKVKKSKKAA